METSILSTIGLEIIGVMSPVSVCMFLVVLLIYSTANPASSAVPIRTAANLVYIESPSDSVSQKLEGALLNALIFTLLLALVTFLLVVLYYYNFTNFLKYYMRLSAFIVLAAMGGPIFVGVITEFGVGIDAVTFLLGLFNFAVVGAFSVFSEGVPILVRQGYMVMLGIIVAAWFTKLPEWTTWVTLVALAVYDLVAVLAPGGPLKILVELASRRDEELPALVYEARPTAEDRSRSSLGHLVGGVSDSASRVVELQAVGDTDRLVERRSSSSEDSVEITDRLGVEGQLENTETEIRSAVTDRLEVRGQFGNTEPEIVVDEERSPLVEILGNGTERDGSESPREMRGGIKLGLGDFIFYSVLVGRAAMFDLMTVYACYLAIIAGLGCTLILLSVCRRALPALPISIALGVLFYFLTRLLMEPFVVGIATNLLMF